MATPNEVTGTGLVRGKGGKTRQKPIGEGGFHFAADRPLPEKALTFCRELVIDWNGTRACVAAGWSPKGARRMASVLMDDPRIGAEIKRLVEERSNRLQFDAERVLHELSLLATSNKEDFIVGNDGEVTTRPGVNREYMRAVSGVDVDVTIDKAGNLHRRVKFRLWDKNTALTNSLKHFGMLVTRHEVKVEGTGVLVVPGAVPEGDWSAVAAAHQAALAKKPEAKAA